MNNYQARRAATSMRRNRIERPATTNAQTRERADTPARMDINDETTGKPLFMWGVFGFPPDEPIDWVMI